MTATRKVYDLASAQADYPVWDGPPERSVVICSHPRSGSTLLGEAVYAAGGLGCPLEYLHRGFRPTFAERWEAPDLAAYVRAMHRHRTDPSGVFSIKLFWRDVEDVVAEGGELFEGECPILPNPTFVLLTRRDRVRQAVSAFIAGQTACFRELPGPASPGPVAEYNYEGILRQLAAADYSNARWRDLFLSTGIEPCCVEYERLASEYDRTTATVFAHLGRVVAPPAPRLRRQATALSEEFVRRFLVDHTGATALE